MLRYRVSFTVNHWAHLLRTSTTPRLYWPYARDGRVRPPCRNARVPKDEQADGREEKQAEHVSACQSHAHARRGGVHVRVSEVPTDLLTD